MCIYIHIHIHVCVFAMISSWLSIDKLNNEAIINAASIQPLQGASTLPWNPVHSLKIAHNLSPSSNINYPAWILIQLQPPFWNSKAATFYNVFLHYNTDFLTFLTILYIFIKTWFDYFIFVLKVLFLRRNIKIYKILLVVNKFVKYYVWQLKKN